MPRTIVFAVHWPVTPTGVAELCDFLGAVLADGETDVVACEVDGVDRPDAATIGVLARLQLTARRAGCRVELRNAGRELRDLLGLTGLAEVLPSGAEQIPLADDLVDGAGPAP
jgi:ABC-type transporter Mla MlaB component